MSLSSHRGQLIGGATYTTPFGHKSLVYADWTASARGHQGIEDFIQRDVLPFYGNTHDHHSLCGHQSTAFREEARQIVAQATNAKLSIGDNEGGTSKDVVIFAGTGATGATNKLVHVLGVAQLVRTATTNGTTLPVVIVGPFEHHSNLLPWRETGARVLRVNENTAGQLDVLELEQMLRRVHATNPPLVVGTFAAASNVTGVLTDPDPITALLHQYNALSVWDYATAGPYVPMDMNPPSVNNQVLSKDAIIFSPHKFLGGLNTPGVLVVKKYLCNNTVPSAPGGGTVFFVTKESHRFLSNRSDREEGGTPDIVGTIRAGLACQLKTSIGSEHILQEERSLSATVHARLRQECPNLIILGPTSGTPRLPIFSFLIVAPVAVGHGLYLHYNFVTRLLNDIFGIQARGGCACAGPYAQDLLGMSNMDPTTQESYSDLFETCLLNKNELLRPGFTRISFPWMLREDEVNYIVSALQSISNQGWKMLPHYKYDHSTGEWSHKSRLNKFPNRIWISRAFNTHMNRKPTASSTGEGQKKKDEKMTTVQRVQRLQVQLEQGRELLLHCTMDDGVYGVYGNSTTEALVLDPLAERLRWFVLPTEVREHLMNADGNDGSVGSARSAESEGIRNAAKSKHTGGRKEEMSIQPRMYDGAKDGAEDGAAVEKEETLAVPVTAMPLIASSSPVTGPLATLLTAVSAPTPPAPTPPTSTTTTTTTTTTNSTNNSSTTATPLVSSTADIHQLRAKLELPEYKGKRNRGKRARIKAKINAIQQQSDTKEDKEERQDGIKSFMNNKIAQKRNQKMSKRMVNEQNVVVSVEKEKEEGEHKNSNSNNTENKNRNKSGKSVKKLQKLNKRRLMVEMGRAIGDWDMIKDGDRILVGVSGGKDSLTLLHLLLALQKKAPIKFDIGAVTVDPGTEAFDPRPLIPYMKQLGTFHFCCFKCIRQTLTVSWVSPPLSLCHHFINTCFDFAGVPYYYENQDHIFLWAEYKNPSSICSFCARMKRGRLYACCRREGYNVLALGQHLDDLAESFLMGAFLNGELRAMKAWYVVVLVFFSSPCCFSCFTCFFLFVLIAPFFSPLFLQKNSYETHDGADTDTMPLPVSNNAFALGTATETKTKAGPTSTTATLSENDNSEESYYTKKFKSNGAFGNETSTSGNTYYSGHIRVVRPLVYVREHECREFARNIHLPVINENCPACFEAPKERRRIKKLLAQQESLFPATFKHLRRAMIPLMSADGTKNLQKYANDRLQSGRIRWNKEENDSNGGRKKRSNK